MQIYAHSKPGHTILFIIKVMKFNRNYVSHMDLNTKRKRCRRKVPDLIFLKSSKKKLTFEVIHIPLKVHNLLIFIIGLNFQAIQIEMQLLDKKQYLKLRRVKDYSFFFHFIYIIMHFGFQFVFMNTEFDLFCRFKPAETEIIVEF